MRRSDPPIIGDMAILRTLPSSCVQRPTQARPALASIRFTHWLRDRASSYTPSSRSFLNPLYIDIEAIPEIADVDLVRSHPRTLASCAHPISSITARLTSQNAGRFGRPLINFAGRRAALVTSVFIASGKFPASRLQHSPHAAARDRRIDPHQNPHTGFDEDFDHEVEFHAFIQWIAHEQLESCVLLAKTRSACRSVSISI